MPCRSCAANMWSSTTPRISRRRDQLRLAASTFAADPGLDCLQAELVIDNAAENWLDGAVRGRVCGAVRADAAAAGPARPADAAGRHQQPLPRPRRCARSAAGMPSTSPRTPISACASPGCAIAPRPSTAAPREEAPIRFRRLDGAADALDEGLDADLHRPQPRVRGLFLEDIGWRGFLGFQV